MLLKKHIEAIYSNNASYNYKYFYVILVVVLAWVVYLQWCVYNLSTKLQKLEFQDNVQPLYAINTHQNKNIVKNTTRNVETMPNLTQAKKPDIFLRRHKRKCNEDCQNRREFIEEMMNKEIIYMHGIKQQNNEFFVWDPSTIGTQSQIKYNQNGTLTFKKRGYYMILSQITVRGQSSETLLSYGYETLLIKNSGSRETLMSSYITQENRGRSLILSTSMNRRHAVDSLSHSVLHFFNINDQIGIKQIPKYSYVNYTQERNTSYLGIIQIS